VTWAITHPGYFEVMYRPGLYRTDDPDVVEASDRAFGVLNSSAAAFAAEWGFDDVEGIVLAGWSMAHGLATLILAGNLEGRYATDPDRARPSSAATPRPAVGAATDLR
jgi:hypothetical protein